MKTFAVRKNDVWLDASGFDSFEPCLMSKTKAEQLASQVGGMVEVYEATKTFEYSIARAPLPDLRLEEK